MFLNKIPAFLFLASSLLCISAASHAKQPDTSSTPQINVERDKAESTVIVDINAATVDELMQLKGIGKKRAEAVFADREQNGKFNRVEDLIRVKGLSEKQVSRIMTQNQGKIQAVK